MASEPQTPDFQPVVPELADDQTRIEVVSVATNSTVQPVADDADKTRFQPSLAPVRAQLEIGDLLKNRFQITDKLGEGGMGMVFKALDLRKVEAKSHKPHIAIKVLHPLLARNETLVAGLQRECEKAQQLSHPNIITVFDFDRDGDYVFMSMEYLSGQPLNHIIREAAPAGGIKFLRAWPIIQQMAKALAYAHRKGIVHSDFKPANAFVTDEHEVKVLDFGIAAKIEHDTDPDHTVFNARAEGGMTPPYASFEMINGAKADPRDDIYAFGLVVYEMLTGKHPYSRKPASTVFIEQQRSGGKAVLLPVKGLSRRQWQVLRSSIELMQDKRPKSLDDWLKEFEPQPWIKPSQWIGGVVAVLVLMISFGVNRWFNLQQQDRSSSPQPAPEMVGQAPPAVTQPVAQVALPLAHAGSDQQLQLGQLAQLDGSASQASDGQALSYAWRLLESPFGSTAQLQQPDSAAPRFTPDKVGEYLAELIVRDGHNSSNPESVRVTVAEMTKPALSHQATSSDGIIELAVSKPSYRIGEKLKINVQVSKAGYLRVAYISSAGEVSEILPNPNQASKVNAGSKLQIPPKGGKFELEVTGPVGNDKIVALFSESLIGNLENIVDSNGDMAAEYLKNNSRALVQYVVSKK